LRDAGCEYFGFSSFFIMCVAISLAIGLFLLVMLSRHSYAISIAIEMFQTGFPDSYCKSWLNLYIQSLCHVELDSVGAWKDSLFIQYGVPTNALRERAFSAVVADNQYAALGLMLLGTLARLGKVLGVEIESQFPAAVEGEEVAKLAPEPLGAESRKRLGESVGGDVDIGVVLRREELRREAESTEEVVIYARTGDTKRPNVLESNADSLIQDSGTSVSISASTIKPQKKRKRKKGDEFDELFSSLI
jgi:hypothetical protein